MNLSMIAYIVGAIMEIEAGLMLLPALVGLIYGEKSALAFVICAAAAAVLGAIPDPAEAQEYRHLCQRRLCGHSSELAGAQCGGGGALLHDRPDSPLHQRSV